MKKSGLILVLLIIVLIPLGWFVYIKFEGTNPELTLQPEVSYLGKETKLSLRLRDKNSGLRKVTVKLKQESKEAVALEKDFPLAGFISGGKVKDETIDFTIDPTALGIGNGKASLTVTVWDYSYREWFHGNKTVKTKDIVVDTLPPVISVLTNTQYLNQGGSGIVCYTSSEKPARGGVQVGETLYPSCVLDSSKNLYVSLFPLPVDTADVRLKLVVADEAGNSASSTFFYQIARKQFRADQLALGDDFVRLIGSRFQDRYPDLGGNALLVMQKVNKEMREQNDAQIREICTQSSPEKLWNGVFMPLPNGATRARFADARTYLYNGKEVGTSVHYGLDFASLANSPVPAANSGRVVWAEPLGIYGNAVIIDHGMGLFSLYGHLSTFKVKKGDSIAKGQEVGLTGFTGYAGGDHLHLGTYVWGVPVNPVEWLDPSWVEKKVEQPMQKARQFK